MNGAEGLMFMNCFDFVLLSEEGVNNQAFPRAYLRNRQKLESYKKGSWCSVGLKHLDESWGSPDAHGT